MAEILTRSSSAKGNIEIAPPARWTVERKFRTAPAATDGLPFSILLLDRQFYQADNACFVRHVRAVNTAEAASKLAQINIPFAPDHEQLTLHWIRIWRDGTPVEQSSSLGQLTIAETKIPNRLSAQCTLGDLQAGDTLDIAYTNRSSSPATQFTARQSINQRVPVGDWHLSLISAPASEVSTLSPGIDLPVQVSQLKDGSNYHRWTLRDVPPAVFPANTPSWYSPSPEIEITTYTSWKQVGHELLQHWEIPTTCPTIRAAADSLLESAEGNTTRAAELAVRLVQNEIETLPTPNLSLTPVAPPSDVLQQGSGDAKSKAAFLMLLLRCLRCPAAAVLVARRGIQSKDSLLPSTQRFDHVIVHAQVEENSTWIDPCAQGEIGSINTPSLPPYGLGLHLSSGKSQLVKVPAATDGQLNIVEHFVVSADLRSTLTITTKATGPEANALRQSAPDTQAGLNEKFLNSLPTSDPEIQDDPTTNTIQIKETFSLPSLIAQGQPIANFSPKSIRDSLPAISDPNRQHPQALLFPRNVSHITVIDTPWEAKEDEQKTTAKHSSFTLSSKTTTTGSRHTLRYQLRTLADHIPVEKLPSAQEQIEHILPALSYRLPIPTPAAAGFDQVKPQRERKKTEQIGKRTRATKQDRPWLMPALGAIAALVLVIVVRGNFKADAAERSDAIREQKIASAVPELEIIEDTKPAVVELPDDPLSFLPPPPPLPGPAGGLDSVEFDLGAPATGTKASTEKNAVSSDWKIGK